MHLLLEESTKFRTAQGGECRETAPRHIPVARNIVTRHDRERGHPPLPTTVQRRSDEAEGGLRSRSRLQIMHDVGIGLVELPADRVEVVAALGDR